MNLLLLKKYHIVGFIISLLLLTSCGNAEIGSVSEDIFYKPASDNAEYHTVSTENPVISDSEDRELSTIQGNSGVMPDYLSISEMFKACDPHWNDSTEYQNAVQSYESALGQDSIDLLMEEDGGVASPRFSFGYVDDDDIPELFMGLGDFHVSGVYVFTYLPDRREVVRIGEFSEFGGIDYIERGNRIISQYGGMGSFLFMYTEISNGKPVLVGSIAEGERKMEARDSETADMDGYEREIVYYAGYQLTEGVDGSHEYDVEWPDDSYRVSAEEYVKMDSELQGNPKKAGKQLKHVDYDDMYTVTLAPGGCNLLREKDELDPEPGEDILNSAFPERVDAWDAYKRIVEVEEEYYKQDGELSYDLADINGDGTDELLIYYGVDHLDKVQIYSYSDHKAVYLGSFGEWGSVEIDPESHIICSKFTGMGSLYEKYYEVNGVNMIKLVELADIAKLGSEDHSEEREYLINGIISSKDEYDAKRRYYSDKHYEIFNNENIRVSNQWLERNRF